MKLVTAVAASVLGLATAGLAPAQSAGRSADRIIQNLDRLADDETRLADVLRANAARKRAIDARYAELAGKTSQLNKTVAEATAFCSGKYDKPEYARRKTICNDKEAKLDREREALTKRRSMIDSDDAARVRDARSLQATYASQQQQLKTIETEISSDAALAAVWTACQSQTRLSARAKCLAGRWAAAGNAAAKAEQDEFDRRNAAWLQRQQDQIRAAAAHDAAWRHEVLTAIAQIRVPSPDLRPQGLADVAPGDILLLMPETGFSPTRLIPPADWIYRIAENWASGETFREAIATPKAPVSHAVTVAKSVDGHLLFLDHTMVGSRILTKAAFEQKYGTRGMFMARPSVPIDGRQLWEAAHDAAIKHKSDYGIAYGKMVCSEKAALAIGKASGISLSNHRIGPIDITPGDFFDERTDGKYFVITPIAH